MMFNELNNGAISCIDWCDLEDDEILIGMIQKYDDGYYRLAPTCSALACGHLKRITEKISELNKG